MEAVTMRIVIEFMMMMMDKTVLMGSKAQTLRLTFLLAAKVSPVTVRYKL